MARRMIGIGFGLLALVVGAISAEPLRARWGGVSGGVVRVLGVDEAGRVRLVPEEHAEGEALVPLREARGLRFVLPEDYARGRQLAQEGRAGEAVLVLRRVAPGLVPFEAVPDSNAGPAVRLYLRLLVQERAWADALAVWLALDPERAGTIYAHESAALARGLQQAKRYEELRLVLERWWVAPPLAGNEESRHAVEAMADALRRDAQWEGAAVLYQKLSDGTEAEERERLDLLLAYLDWHRGSDLGAQAALWRAEVPSALGESGVIFRLLRARLGLRAGRVEEAADALAEALVGAGGNGEWRAEILAVLASAYAERGEAETALRIATDLRRQFPDSRWVKELEGTIL